MTLVLKCATVPCARNTPRFLSEAKTSGQKTGSASFSGLWVIEKRLLRSSTDVILYRQWSPAHLLSFPFSSKPLFHTHASRPISPPLDTPTWAGWSSCSFSKYSVFNEGERHLVRVLQEHVEPTVLKLAWHVRHFEHLTHDPFQMFILCLDLHPSPSKLHAED